MAKVGEGDPRWIVSERQDGQNVNKWHWVEKEVSSWVKDTVNRLFENEDVVSNDAITIKCTTVSSFEGDTTVYNRKGRVSYIMDIKFGINWEGTSASNGKVRKGKIDIPELEHDSRPSSVQINITCDDDESELLKYMRDAGRAWVRDRIQRLQTAISEEYGVGRESKTPPSSVASPMSTESPTTIANERPKPLPAVKSMATSYTAIIEWGVPPAILFDTLTNEAKCNAYTRSKCKFERRVGGDVVFLSGAITGTITEFVENERIGMKWRNAASSHVSDVLLTLESYEQGVCTMTLQHTNIAPGDLESIRQGWRNNFWEPIKVLFGYNYKWKQGDFHED